MPAGVSSGPREVTPDAPVSLGGATRPPRLGQAAGCAHGIARAPGPVGHLFPPQSTPAEPGTRAHGRSQAAVRGMEGLVNTSRAPPKFSQSHHEHLRSPRSGDASE